MKILLLLLALVGLARADGTSTSYEWLPTRPTTASTTAWPTAGTMRCVEVVPELTITATEMAWNVTGGLGAGTHCSFTIYNATGSSQIATSGAVSCASTATVTVTGISSFTLTAGTKVQVCTCADANGGSYLSASSASSAITTLQNALSTPIGSTATNTCTAAVAPATTGVLSGTAVNVPIILVAVTGF